MIGFGIDPLVTRELQNKFRKMEEEAKDEIIALMHNIGLEEEIATKRRMKRKSRGANDLYDKVAEGVDFRLEPSPFAQGLPFIRFGVSSRTGAGDFQGVKGSRGENIAGIVAFGKAKGKKLTEKISVKKGKYYAGGKTSWGGTGGTGYGFFRTILKKGWQSPKKEKDTDLIQRASENMEEQIMRRIPDAIQRAYGNKTIDLRRRRA